MLMACGNVNMLVDCYPARMVTRYGILTSQQPCIQILIEGEAYVAPTECSRLFIAIPNG